MIGSGEYSIKTIYEILDAYLKEVEDAIRQNMDTHGRNASGRSVRSLRRVVVSDSRAYLEGLKSFLVMERGRKAGKVPRGFVGIIRQWIIDKGLPVRLVPAKTWRGDMRKSPYDRGLDRMAGAIAYTIRNKGTRLHRRKGFDDIFTTAINEVTDRLSRELELWAGLKIERIHQEA